MNTLEIGKKLVELCRQGKAKEAIASLIQPQYCKHRGAEQSVDAGANGGD